MSDDMQDMNDATTNENASDVNAGSGDDQGYQFEDASNEPTPATNHQSEGSNSGDRRYANELFSKSIHAKFRTFYVDLKESQNGKFVKISEKSRGRKSTIMMDAEDVAEMITTLQEVQEKL